MQIGKGSLTLKSKTGGFIYLSNETTKLFVGNQSYNIIIVMKNDYTYLIVMFFIIIVIVLIFVYLYIKKRKRLKRKPNTEIWENENYFIKYEQKKVK